MRSVAESTITMTIDYEPITPPGRLDTLQEFRLPIDMLRWAPAWLSQKARGAGPSRALILLPGFGAGPASLRIMASYLRRRGHHVRDWGLGRNTGNARQLREGIEPIVRQWIASHGEPVTLIGWSLGGYIAREYARERPDDVRRVITLGSPVIGGPRYTATAEWYRSQGHDLEQMERAVANRYATPLRVPVTAIYSKRDGIVAWQACIDRWSPDVRHIEVNETHVGMGFAPRVLSIIADEIA